MLRGYSREEKSWMLYDWANSAFATIMMAIILPIFFKQVALSGGITDTNATAYWGYANSAGTLLCAVLAPFLGALGDRNGMKKKLFTLFMLVGVVSSVLLAAAANWQMLAVLYITGTIGFNCSCIYYDSFLLDVTTHARMDRVSSLGYGLGYIGGSTIPLVFSLLLISFGEAIGVSAMTATRFSFVLTGIWWFVFSIPMLRHVQVRRKAAMETHVISAALHHMKKNLSLILRNKRVLFFILAYFFYIDGVGTVIRMATVFGDSCGLGSMDMMLVLMVLQLVAFPCAILYGRLAERFGARRMILVGIATYILVCAVGVNLKSLSDFIILAILVGTAQGGIQALSRSFFGKLIPQDESAEYFGFFDIFGKFSAVIGPALFGVMVQLTGSPQLGVVPVLFMFLIGGALLLFGAPKDEKQL